MMMVTGKCDRCPKVFETRPNGRDTILLMRAAMRNSGWLYKNQKDICPDCAKKVK